MATVRLDDLLAEMVERNASDMFMKAGVAPHMRVDGKIISMDYDELNMDDVQAVAYGLMTEEQIHRFEKVPEMDLAMGVRGVGRFRVNLFRQRGSIGMVFRHVKSPTFNFGDLLLPDSVRMLSEKHRGLVLVTGTTGSGKSTTLAAMINHINETRKCHIVTIEDPIEFLHSDKTAIISQREVGFDTKTFADALRHVLRQAPDVILVGEMRDLETVGTSISAAETGHLVLSTLHTIDAVQTIERIINFYPAYLHTQIRMELSLGLQGVISQRLVPKKRGLGRVPAVEVLVSSPLVKKHIHEGKTMEIPQLMEAGAGWGMQSFKVSLFNLIQAGHVSEEEAMQYASSPEELRLLIDGITSGVRMDGDTDSMGFAATPIPIAGRKMPSTTPSLKFKVGDNS
jgi:twitching motility protein PilT